MEFLQAFGAVFGILAGGGLLVLLFKIGATWGELRQDVTDTAKIVGGSAVAISEILPRVQRIEQTLHGVSGDNGLYSDVKELKRRFEDSPSVPTRRKTDRRKVS